MRRLREQLALLLAPWLAEDLPSRASVAEHGPDVVSERDGIVDSVWSDSTPELYKALLFKKLDRALVAVAEDRMGPFFMEKTKRGFYFVRHPLELSQEPGGFPSLLSANLEDLEARSNNQCDRRRSSDRRDNHYGGFYPKFCAHCGAPFACFVPARDRHGNGGWGPAASTDSRKMRRLLYKYIDTKARLVCEMHRMDSEAVKLTGSPDSDGCPEHDRVKARTTELLKANGGVA